MDRHKKNDMNHFRFRSVKYVACQNRIDPPKNSNSELNLTPTCLTRKDKKTQIS